MPPIQTDHKRYFGIILVFVLSFSLRMYAIIFTVIDGPIRADASDYYKYALNLKYHQTFSRQDIKEGGLEPDAVRSPGYPVFLIPFVKHPPTDAMLFRINMVQSLLDSICVTLAYGIFRYFIPAPLAFAGSMLIAFSPHLISMNTYLLTETLFTFLMILFLWLTVKAFANNNKAISFITGLVLAFAVLTRPALQYFIIPLAALLFYRNSLRPALRLVIPLVLGFLIIISPWVLRNLSITGNVSDPTLALSTIHHGIYPDFTYNDLPASRGIPYRFDPNSSKISESYETILSEITRRFKEEPYRHLKWYLIDKPITFFSWYIIAGMGDVFIYPAKQSPYFNNRVFIASHAFMKSIHWPLVILALITS
ncbi:MAG: hypothetical protein QG578_444, partial [Thermodesulfobacteriota bacterium]|nr:hypothetical protein [Thermodesulfobacteriota bacterium]